MYTHAHAHTRNSQSLEVKVGVYQAILYSYCGRGWNDLNSSRISCFHTFLNIMFRMQLACQQDRENPVTPTAFSVFLLLHQAWIEGAIRIPPSCNRGIRKLVVIIPVSSNTFTDLIYSCFMGSIDVNPECLMGWMEKILEMPEVGIVTFEIPTPAWILGNIAWKSKPKTKGIPWLAYMWKPTDL